MDELLKDSRFAHIPKDPKFRRIPKHERKIKIDKRFQSMFNDKKFSVKYTIDKRGRPISNTSSEDLKKYYELSSSSDDTENDDDNENENEKITNKSQVQSSDEKKSLKKKKSSKKVSQQSETKKQVKSKIKKNKQHIEVDSIDDNEEVENENERKSDESANPDESEDESEKSNIDEAIESENERQLNIRNDNEDKNVEKNIKKKLRDLTIDYARGEGVLLSDSSSEEESSEEESEDDDIDHNWGELDKEAETTDEITSRLAACNMDWDRIRAVDLMVLFNSFLPPTGLIHSVKIYPSKFGKQRMKDEDVMGPIELADKKNIRDDLSNDDDEEGNEYHMEKMRQYQLNRLKYYYAVITCDCPATANKIYTECDGIEYESTATKFDLRFIPEDMTFDDEPREVCDSLPELAKYQPRQFTTTALQQVKVELTWDETNPERMEITQKLNSGKIDDIDQNDINAYLASGTSDDESESDEDEIKNDTVDENDKDPIEKYKSLLKSIEEKEEEEKNKKLEMELTWDVGAQGKTEKLVQEKMKQMQQMTPFEKYLEKVREKKKAKKDKKNTELHGDDMNHETMSESDDSIPSDLDMNDPYFAEEMKNMKKSSKKKTKKTEEKNKAPPSDDEENAKAELELLMLDDDEKDKNHFNMKTIENNEALTKSKKKRLSKKMKTQKESIVEDNFKVDVTDPRFSALFTSHHYNIDPADPHYRNTPGTTALINEQLKRRANKMVEEEVPIKQAKTDDILKSDLAAMVKSVKKNTKNNISKRIK
ncbi:hypothetical protein PV328_009682 [Microctonus aethiopoides]|uniref:NUC153 domain-containing protein n=1 Tax=Microctonus aethiopoides TaxID=144406 RepID=A0AA39C6B6_9HYME|nr:hypothetical protein PV328_009682 [Microctonus aethiopoides]